MTRRHRAVRGLTAQCQPAKGKLGVMIPGMGAVATTFVAGVEAIRKGLAKPIGSLTQMGTVRLGKRTDGRSPKVKEFVPLAGLDDLVFTGWDIFEDNMYEGGLERGSARSKPARPVEAVPFVGDAARSRVRSQLREEDRWAEREEGQDQDGSRRAVARRHPRLQEDQRREPADHDVVRFDRVLHRGDRSPSVGEVLRESAARERRDDRAVDDLRLRVIDGRRALRQWRAEPDRGSAGDARTLAAERSAHLRQRFQDRADL